MIVIDIDRLKNELVARLHPVVDQAIVDMQTACPVDTGALRLSIRSAIEAGGDEIILHFLAGGGKVDYAQYVEYGNSNPNYPVQPFMRPTFYQIPRRIISALNHGG